MDYFRLKQQKARQSLHDNKLDTDSNSYSDSISALGVTALLNIKTPLKSCCPCKNCCFHKKVAVACVLQVTKPLQQENCAGGRGHEEKNRKMPAACVKTLHWLPHRLALGCGRHWVKDLRLPNTVLSAEQQHTNHTMARRRARCLSQGTPHPTQPPPQHHNATESDQHQSSHKQRSTQQCHMYTHTPLPKNPALLMSHQL